MSHTLLSIISGSYLETQLKDSTPALTNIGYDMNETVPF
jgi:hypothetical protein